MRGGEDRDREPDRGKQSVQSLVAIENRQIRLEKGAPGEPEDEKSRMIEAGRRRMTRRRFTIGGIISTTDCMDIKIDYTDFLSV
jgi:hypothetical protein